MGTPPGESAGRQAAQNSNAAGAAWSPGSELLPASDPAATRPTTGPVIPPRPPSAPPSSVIAAVKLMYVGAGLSLLGMLYGLTTRVQTRERLAADDPDQTEAELALAVDVKTGIGVTIGLIAFGMWLWMAQTNLSGLRWARIVATVLFGLNVIVTFYGMTQTTGFGIVVSIVSICLAGAILWLLYRQESTAYFVARSDGARGPGM
jgi:hypothetical protein